MEENAKCWFSATLTMLPGSCAQLKHLLVQDLGMAQEAQPTTMWIRLSPSLLPGRFKAYHTLHWEAQVIQLGSSHRQGGEVCTEPSIAVSIAGDQGAVGRLADKKELLFLNLKHTIISYPSQCQVLFRSATLHRKQLGTTEEAYF